MIEKTDLDLVQPGGVERELHKPQRRPLVLEPLHGYAPAV